ncbi:MAG: alpha,alpha-trehalase TreF [Chitinophagaceae bacterium]|nr:alpha,alpha-trehalase TreF [Chitinophagaceae bacterium]
MKKSLVLVSLQFFVCLLLIAQQPAPPDKIFGELFHEVQVKRIFSDGKTFVDCIPKREPKNIMSDYFSEKDKSTFDLRKFVTDNFLLPSNPSTNYQTDTAENIIGHIKKLWKILYRPADISSPAAGGVPAERTGSSLLALPYPYIVPGGRFREIYYWDSYFTMLGLKESGEFEMIENMVKNFAYLINHYGHIPNGNRTYYLGRSQPPFFAAMVNLLAEIKGDSIYKTYLPALEKEYKYWMEGSSSIRAGQAFRRVVKLKDGTVMNRYWDDIPAPRPESYREDIETANGVVQSMHETIASKSESVSAPITAAKLRENVYRHLRAGAESGIDFSSRWFLDNKSLITIHTTDFIPPDLNALLYNLELTISKGKMQQKDEIFSNMYRRKAMQRQKAIQKYCYNDLSGFYYDYDFISQQKSKAVTPAGMYPFFFFENNPGKVVVDRMVVTIKDNLLKPGGIASSVYNTGEQWDAPNGWPPLQWMTIGGLEKLGRKEFAKDIAQRWIKLNIKVYKETGKLMEKYDVADITRLAGGGEYPSQDGFGWTNGVLLKLIAMYGMPQETTAENKKNKSSFVIK